jgi:cupin superfamily acireductone dioxygenase involved in methionine salvage
MIKHEDDRRIIFDWAQGNFKSAKAVIIKEEMAVGDHLHKNKEEEFFLLSGRFLEITVGNLFLLNIDAPYHVKIPKNTYHKFVCEKGSVLLGVATELFDPNDEIKL